MTARSISWGDQMNNDDLEEFSPTGFRRWSSPETAAAVLDHLAELADQQQRVSVGTIPLAAALGIGRNTANQAIRRLRAEGRLTILRGGTGKAYPCTYQLLHGTADSSPDAERQDEAAFDSAGRRWAAQHERDMRMADQQVASRDEQIERLSAELAATKRALTDLGSRVADAEAGWASAVKVNENLSAEVARYQAAVERLDRVILICKTHGMTQNEVVVNLEAIKVAALGDGAQTGTSAVDCTATCGKPPAETCASWGCRRGAAGDGEW